jgi:hypothetical protein
MSCECQVVAVLSYPVYLQCLTPVSYLKDVNHQNPITPLSVINPPHCPIVPFLSSCSPNHPKNCPKLAFGTLSNVS